MTKQEIVHLVDDLNGDTAHETVSFGLDGNLYEIDLSDAHAATLRDHLSFYVTAARPAATRPEPSTRRRGGPGGAGPRSRSEARAIRSWARTNGHQLADRGRIPAGIELAYRDAGDPAPVSPTPAPGSQSVSRSASPSDAPSAKSPGSAAPTDTDVLAWHEAKNYKIPADRTVNGLMRHRYRTAHKAVD